MRTTYGCDLPERLFTVLTPTTPEDDIRRAVAQWLPLLTINEVKFTEREIYRENGIQDQYVDVEVRYTTPSRKEAITSMTISGSNQ